VRSIWPENVPRVLGFSSSRSFGRMRGMADDWRVTVDFDEDADGTELTEWLRAIELAADERERFGDRIVVSRDGSTVFLYADSETAAREVDGFVRAQLGRKRLPARVSLERWHPVEQAWKDPGEPLPTTEDERRAEHERLQAREAAESLASGHAGWEVRVELPDHDATVALGRRLDAEGLPVVRRSRFLLVGAVNEDAARTLAERIRREAPEGSRIDVEPGGDVIWEVLPQNPFSVFGGLGG
jgi:hypothetical protein